MAAQLCSLENMAAILAANAEDMAAAKGHISEVMLDRLALTEQRIRAMAKGMEEVAALPDPVGRVLKRVERPNGLVIEKTAVPMGVIAIIYLKIHWLLWMTQESSISAMTRRLSWT